MSLSLMDFHFVICFTSEIERLWFYNFLSRAKIENVKKSILVSPNAHCKASYLSNLEENCVPS